MVAEEKPEQVLPRESATIPFLLAGKDHLPPSSPEGMKICPIGAIRIRLNAWQEGPGEPPAVAMHEVMNQAQVQIGVRIGSSPLCAHGRGFAE